MPKVSVIVPVYGVEKYIERCARSLFEQTLDDIEYIFIDDCSPDDSIKILKNIIDDYPMRKGQVIIHRMEHNSGQAIVREWGVKNASGDYIIHCDSDDWVDTDIYKCMYDEAVSNNADLVISDFYISDGKEKQYVKDYAYSNQSRVFYDILVRKITSSLCNKLCNRTIFSNHIEFPQNDMGEDHALLVQMAYYCKSTVKVDKPLYYYFDNTKSITRESSREATLKRFTDSVENGKTIMNFMEYNNIANIYSNELIRMLLNKKNHIRPLINEKRYYELWINTFKFINSRILVNPCISFREKVKFVLTYLRLYKKAA